MCEQDDRRRTLPWHSTLPQAVQAHLMLAKRVADVADNAGCVLCLESNVKSALAIFDGAQRHFARIDHRLKIGREIGKPQRACEVYQISDNGARSGHLTGARAD